MLTLEYCRKLALSLLIGAIGGLVFYWLHMPLPWMLGAMVFSLIAALLRLPVVSARRIRPPLLSIIGVTLGSTFYPAVFHDALGWLPITAAAVVSTISFAAIGYIYLSKVAKFDPVTAYFAGMPGGVYEMTVQGGMAGGDERKIAVVQAVRIFLVVLLVPIYFRFFLGADSRATGGVIGHPGDVPLSEYIELIVWGVLGFLIGPRLRLPNPYLFGPLIVSAIAHLAGITQSTPPSVLLWSTQVVMGTAIGGQFIGVNVRFVLQLMRHGIVLLPILMLVCVLIATITAHFTNVGSEVIVLALAPGGTTEMALVALALRADIAIILIHQLMRVVMIHGLAGLVFSKLR